jgi:hypothetical protein
MEWMLVLMLAELVLMLAERMVEMMVDQMDLQKAD